MTTEETELTFVRCPNCRSLIPAIATRCRMCGTQFEKKADGSPDAGGTPPAADSFGGQKQSRVRQRTISASPDEVDHLKRTIADQPPPPENGTSNQRAQALPEEQVDEDTSAAFEEINDTFLRPLAEPEPEEENISAPAAEEDEWSDDSDLDEGEEDDTGSDEAAPFSQPTGERKRRRRRRRKKRGTTSEGAHAAPADQFEPEHQPLREQFQHSAPQSSSHVETAMSFQEPTPPVRPESPRREQESRPADAARSDGALVGWLVDFSANAKGSATELRAGKFFIGRQKLRGNDLVLGHQSISTPHCIVTAGGAEGLSVQDLMSDGGTYLRRGGGSYALVQNTTTIEHGDWLKFGDFEVLICLVPQSGRGRR